MIVVKLSEDVLYDQLSKQLDLERFGADISTLSLCRPVYFTQGMTLQKGKLYLCRPDLLAQTAPTQGCLIICTGKPPLSWLDRRCSVLSAPASTNLFELMNLVQLVFDKYDEWEAKLIEIQKTSNRISDMIIASFPIFENPIDVVDADLFLIVASGDGTIADAPAPTKLWDRREPMPAEYTKLFADVYKEYSSRREPYLVSVHGNHYCINLYSQDIYLGCMSLSDPHRPISDADRQLFEFLADFVQLAFRTQTSFEENAVATNKSVLYDILMGIPVPETTLVTTMEKWKQQGVEQLVCMVIMPDEFGADTLPGNYVCKLLEENLADSCAIAYHPYVTAFVPARGGEDLAPLTGELDAVMEALHCRCSISEPYSDISKTNRYYRQACTARETAYRLNWTERVTIFDETCLSYMLLHANGEFTAEALMPPGLRELLKTRGENGVVDYWDTLKQYLDHEMNASETARSLYLHRNAFLKRLEKIQRTVSLDTAEDRLRLRLCIAMLEAEEQERNA